MFNFEEALIAIKEGNKVQRFGWNGKGMFISVQIPDDNSKMTQSYLYITTTANSTNQFGSDGAKVNRIPWLPSQTDLFANDWQYYVD